MSSGVPDVSEQWISREADDLKVENRHLYCLILQLVLDLNELEDACGRPWPPQILQSRKSPGPR